MKSIGIFTIYIANYGAVLQTYALQKYLRETYPDLKVSIVDFYSSQPYNIFKKASNNALKNLIKQGTRLLYFSSLKRRNSREKRFIKEEFILSKRFDSLEELLKSIPPYDIYLTGSDQVFDLNSKYCRLFYQQFSVHNALKAAYAPSFGTSSFSDDQIKQIYSFVQGFDFLSCREDDGALMLSNLLGKKVPLVLDPTLLLSKKQWLNMSVYPKSRNNYLLIYDLNGGQRMIDIAVPLAKKYNWQIWCITQHTEVQYKNVDKVIFDAGPREFVGLFSKAQYVITDSFHGTSFSIIFEKPFKTFIAIPRSSRRIISLLSMAGFCDRIIYPDHMNSYDFVGERKTLSLGSLEEMKKKSMDYIYKIVSA